MLFVLCKRKQEMGTKKLVDFLGAGLNWDLKSKHRSVLHQRSSNTMCKTAWVLSKASDKNSFLLSLQNPRPEKVYLSGYGVELAIKSQEYKAKDDTQVQGANTHINTRMMVESRRNRDDNKVIDCGFRGGCKCHGDRREWSCRRGAGIPFWQTEVSRLMTGLDRLQKPHHIHTSGNLFMPPFLPQHPPPSPRA